MTCSETFGYDAGNTKHNKTATTFRSVVLHLKYGVFVLLGALVWASLMADYGTGADAGPRKDHCRLFGASAKLDCPALEDGSDQASQNETIYGLGVAVAVINAGLLVLSLFTHLHPKDDQRRCSQIQYNGFFRFLTCAINVALFVALIVSFRDDDDKNDGAKLLAKANLENSVYFKDTFDPYIAAAFGLGFSLIDAVVGSYVIFGFYGTRCSAEDADQP